MPLFITPLSLIVKRRLKMDFHPLLFGYRQQITGPNLPFPSFATITTWTKVITKLNEQSHFHLSFVVTNNYRCHPMVSSYPSKANKGLSEASSWIKGSHDQQIDLLAWNYYLICIVCKSYKYHKFIHIIIH